jgi:hypothetical protein
MRWWRRTLAASFVAFSVSCRVSERPTIGVRSLPVMGPEAGALVIDGGVAAVSPPWGPSAVETDPSVFSREGLVDVDQDGVQDRTAAVPWSNRDRYPSWTPFPPFLWVAHGQRGGGFVREDSLTRAAARAACPEAPHLPLALSRDAFAETERLIEEGSAREHARAALAVLMGGCALVWGARPEEIDRSFEPTAASALGVSPEILAEVRASVREMRAPFVLRPRSLPPLPAREVIAPPLEGTALTFAANRSDDGPTCLSVTSANRRALERSRRAAHMPNDQSVGPEDKVACIQRGGRGWGLFARDVRVRFDPGSGDWVMDTRWDLAPIGPAGSPRVVAARVETRYTMMSGASEELVAIFDWDDDGTPEVAVRREDWATDTAIEQQIRVFTVRAGRVVPFEPVRPLERIDGIEDVDRDGRPDLVLPTRWQFSDGCGMEGRLYLGPPLLAHALRGGTFSLTDDVARAHVQRACDPAVAPRSEEDGVEDDGRAERGIDGEALVRELACGRVWGADPESLVAWARARPELQDLSPTLAVEDGETCFGFTSLASVALVAPPFEPLPPGGVRPLPPRSP